MSKILHYCQHVLGIGHLFRSLEICKAFEGHDVVFVNGGPRADIPLPSHIREIKLPGLMMDEGFKGLLSIEKGITVEQVKEERKKLLYEVFEQEAPDIFIIELYPFGRKAFRFELDPILEGISEEKFQSCSVICSLRDILVEKQDPVLYENRVVSILNRYFDALLVHSDPTLITLDKTFSSIDKISIPIVYTGFVAPKPLPDARSIIRRRLGIAENDIFIVTSAGGGKVGYHLLDSVISALGFIENRNRLQAHLFAGPYMHNLEFERLESRASEKIKVERFTNDFLSYLTAADLSISMAGYNTSMDIMAVNVPALIWPFPQNREQRMRAEKLSSLGVLHVLDDKDLQPSHLAGVIMKALSKRPSTKGKIDLEGARNTSRWLESWKRNRGRL